VLKAVGFALSGSVRAESQEAGSPEAGSRICYSFSRINMAFMSSQGSIPAAIFGLIIIAVVLLDAFETVVLPRRVTRQFKLTAWSTGAPGFPGRRSPATFQVGRDNKASWDTLAPSR